MFFYDFISLSNRCTSTPDECIGWLSFGLKWKKVGFSFGIVITLSIFVY